MKLPYRAVAPSGLPIYGNWCGPGYGSGTPTDEVDACCMVHDHCYDAHGYFHCDCDHALIACLAPKTNPFTAKGRAAGLMTAWFAGQPCNPF